MPRSTLSSNSLEAPTSLEAPAAPGTPGTSRPGVPRRRAARRSRRWPRWLVGLAFVAPSLLVLGVVIAFPVVDTVWLSLMETRGKDRTVFVGLANYGRLLQDADFWSAFRNSISFTAGSVLGHILLGLAVALLLNQRIPFRPVFRVISLVPWMFAPVVVAMTWRWMLDAQLGVINFLLASLGLRGPFLWFESARLALPAIILTNIWRGFPFASITLLAALQAIPKEQYEAAAVDGASSLMQFRFVTLPHLRFALVIIATLDTIWNFKHFDLIQVMTNGGPAGATEMLTTLTYKVSFENFEFGYAAAMGVVMSLILLATTVVYVRRIL
jgi:multiple sugar transport system permease protein